MKQETIIEETIDAIDHIDKAKISPYFKTRMNAILNAQKETESAHGLQPLALLTFSIVLLLINTLLITKSNSTNTSYQKNNSTSVQQQFSEDYNINNSSNFYYDDKQ